MNENFVMYDLDLHKEILRITITNDYISDISNDTLWRMNKDLNYTTIYNKNNTIFLIWQFLQKFKKTNQQSKLYLNHFVKAENKDSIIKYLLKNGFICYGKEVINRFDNEKEYTFYYLFIDKYMNSIVFKSV